MAGTRLAAVQLFTLQCDRTQSLSISDPHHFHQWSELIFVGLLQETLLSILILSYLWSLAEILGLLNHARSLLAIFHLHMPNQV